MYSPQIYQVLSSPVAAIKKCFFGLAKLSYNAEDVLRCPAQCLTIEGYEQVRSLSHHAVPCQYILLVSAAN